MSVRRRRAPTELRFETDNWSCPLKCNKCTFTRPNGLRCKNRVCFGFPLCWIHNSQKFGVKIKQSTIPGAGKGLFATRQIPKNTWICPYSGEETTMECIHQRYPGDSTAPYAEKISDNIAYDCACSRGIGSLANGRFNANGKVSSVRRHNCISRYRPVGEGVPGVWLKSTKDIKSGEELMNWYGDGGYQLQQNHSTRRRRRAPDTRPC
ncbi:putative lysine methyltransferase [Feldmannia species virus]|uniref:Putative lysine methyltransferase n=1 Tax=Feldmannia species virus TaxID=39420 RepID=B5LWM5_9PHYC|nr:putative lysine methyltransferase [Feldmannia species virus]ACH46888.1 putative lysine methyltransferase [Feldmannia species virus]